MINPESFYDNPTSHPEKPAPPVSAPIPGSDADLGERLFGGGGQQDFHEGGLTREQEMAETLFPDQGEDAPEPVYHRFDVPEDLAHLGLVHDPIQHREFSRLGFELGLDQEAAQKLITTHLRAAYRGRR